jgi:RNA polymerase sigma factor (TIGR02999 family)
MNDVTRILSAIEHGDSGASEELLPLVYDELRKLAAQRLAQERPGQTLQATALVHEAYLRLVVTEEARRWNSRGHFFAAAAEAMRRILIDSARRKRAEKRGRGDRRVDLEQAGAVASAPPDELLALDEALDHLARHDALSGQLVKLHYFAGLSVEQAGEVLGLSRATAYRQMTFARAWLRCQMSGEGDAESREDALGEK